MSYKICPELISLISKNSEYVKNNIQELEVLLAAQRTAQQTPDSGLKFRSALVRYYLAKLHPTLEISLETLREALKSTFFCDLHDIKYTLLVSHSLSLQACNNKIQLSFIKEAAILVRPSLDFLKSFERIDFQSLLSLVKNFSYKDTLHNLEALLLEVIYFESGASYRKSSQATSLALTTLHSKRKKYLQT